MRVEISARVKKVLKLKRVWLVIAVLIFVYWLLVHGGANTKLIKLANVEKKTIKAEITAAGKIDSSTNSTLHFGVGGRVAWVSAKEGDKVEKGQVIASLDAEQYQILVRQTKQDVIAADAELARVYDDISKASGVESFNNRIMRTAAEAKKNKAFDAEKEAERELRETTLIAPVAGTITKISVSPLEEVFATTEIATIVDPANIEFKAEVDETEVPTAKVGQKVEVVLDAFGNAPINSEVREIGQQSVTTSTGATAFIATINIPASEQYKVGMNGEAKILTKQVDEALVIGQDALVDDAFVWVVHGGSYEKRPVEKGISSDVDVEVLGGLSVGDRVVVGGFGEIGKKSLIQKILKQ